MAKGSASRAVGANFAERLDLEGASANQALEAAEEVLPDSYRQLASLIVRPRGGLAFSPGRQGEPPAESEGPTGISIEVFQPSPLPPSVEDWVRTNQRSNFGLGPGELRETSVGVRPASPMLGPASTKGAAWRCWWMGGSGC